MSNTAVRLTYLALFVSVTFSACVAVELWVIDTDAGADDAVAILSFLAMEEIEKSVRLVGITTVQGNTNVDNVARNVLKILDVARRLDVPVFKGLNESILITPPGDNFFGEDGFGDFYYPNPPSEDLIEELHGAVYLADVVQRYPNKINLLAIGPLSNLALAARLNPQFISNLKSLYILGGSVKSVGNIRPGVEFNFHVDPEACFIVFDAAIKCERRINLLPWEAALALGISKEWRKDVLGKIPSNVVDILNKAENQSLNYSDETSWISSDTYAVLWATDPNFPVETDLTMGKVETAGNFARGAILLDYMNTTDEYQQLNIARPGSLDVTYVQDKLLSLFSAMKFGPVVEV